MPSSSQHNSLSPTFPWRVALEKASIAAWKRMRYERVKAAQKKGEVVRATWHQQDEKGGLLAKVKEKPKNPRKE
ncbi:hypothetical protein BGX38DRAFT_1175821 [Terfezia claveryi]|nr:hypothetical protein BGX38DRAFT_1175821 [Terfezia claveryi]